MPSQQTRIKVTFADNVIINDKTYGRFMFHINDAYWSTRGLRSDEVMNLVLGDASSSRISEEVRSHFMKFASRVTPVIPTPGRSMLASRPFRIKEFKANDPCNRKVLIVKHPRLGTMSVTMSNRRNMEPGSYDSSDSFILDFLDSPSVTYKREMMKYEMIKFVVSKANPDISMGGVTLLMRLLMYGCPQHILLDVINRSSKDLEEFDDKGLTAIHYCQSIEDLELLLSLGAKFKFNQRIMDNLPTYGCTHASKNRLMFAEKYMSLLIPGEEDFDSTWMIVDEYSLSPMAERRMVSLIKSSLPNRKSRLPEHLSKENYPEAMRKFLSINREATLKIASMQTLINDVDVLGLLFDNGFDFMSSAFKRELEDGYALGEVSAEVLNFLKNRSSRSFDFKGMCESALNKTHLHLIRDDVAIIMAKCGVDMNLLILRDLLASSNGNNGGISDELMELMIKSGNIPDASLLGAALYRGWLNVIRYFVGSGKDLIALLHDVLEESPTAMSLYTDEGGADCWSAIFGMCENPQDEFGCKGSFLTYLMELGANCDLILLWIKMNGCEFDAGASIIAETYMGRASKIRRLSDYTPLIRTIIGSGCDLGVYDDGYDVGYRYLLSSGDCDGGFRYIERAEWAEGPNAVLKTAAKRITSLASILLQDSYSHELYHGDFIEMVTSL